MLDGSSKLSQVRLPDMSRGGSGLAKQQMRPASPAWPGVMGHQQEQSRCVNLRRDERKYEHPPREAGGVQKLGKQSGDNSMIRVVVKVKENDLRE